MNYRGSRTEVITLRVSKPVKAALKELAEEKQGTIGQVVRMAIVEHLKKKFPD